MGFSRDEWASIVIFLLSKDVKTQCRIQMSTLPRRVVRSKSCYSLKATRLLDCDRFLSFTKIQTLVIDIEHVTTKEIRKEYAFSRTLCRLFVCGDNISADGIYFLNRFVSCLPTLEYLYFDSVFLGAMGTKYLVNALPFLPNLCHLWIDSAEIEPRYLMKRLRGDSKPIQSLSLSSNSLFYEGVRLFSRFLSSSALSRMRHLCLDHNLFGAKGARKLAIALPSIPNLCSLSVGWNFILDEGIRYLVEAFGSTPNLVSLNLCGNGFRDDGIRTLVGGFDTIPNLRHLDLGCNNLLLEDVRLLATGINRLSNLEELLLDGNRLNEQQALEYFPKKTHLEILL